MAGQQQDSDRRDGTLANKEPEITHPTEAKNTSASSNLEVSLLLHLTKKSKI